MILDIQSGCTDPVMSRNIVHLKICIAIINPEQGKLPFEDWKRMLRWLEAVAIVALVDVVVV